LKKHADPEVRAGHAYDGEGAKLSRKPALLTSPFQGEATESLEAR
jgi:hypothetical protein